MAKREYSEEDTTMSLRLDGVCLMGNIRDAQTVLNVMNEAWSDKHESLLGALDLLDHKLAMIESATKSLLEKASFPLTPGRPAAEKGLCSSSERMSPSMEKL